MVHVLHLFSKEIRKGYGIATNHAFFLKVASA